MSTPVAIGAAIAFLIAAVVVAKVFDSPLSLIILVAMILLVYGFVRFSSKDAP